MSHGHNWGALPPVDPYHATEPQPSALVSCSQCGAEFRFYLDDQRCCPACGWGQCWCGREGYLERTEALGLDECRACREEQLARPTVAEGDGI